MRDFLLVDTILDILDDYLYDTVIDFTKPYDFYYMVLTELDELFQTQPRYNNGVRWFIPLLPTFDAPFYHFKKKRFY